MAWSDWSKFEDGTLEIKMRHLKGHLFRADIDIIRGTGPTDEVWVGIGTKNEKEMDAKTGTLVDVIPVRDSWSGDDLDFKFFPDQPEFQEGENGIIRFVDSNWGDVALYPKGILPK